MCGIVVSSPAAPEIVNQALNELRERGPDDQRVDHYTFASLGIARLAIKDITGGKQPLRSASGRTACAFNGAIYNHAQLRDRFKLKVPSDNDGAIIPELYELLGLEFADFLEGMYSVILLDITQEKVVLARDLLGIKPLYWCRQGSGLMAASKIAAFPSPMRRYASQFPPGIVWSSDERFRKIHTTAPMANGELSTELRLAVRAQIPLEVPWACMLSGGVDSSLVTTLARELRTPVVAYSVGVQGSEDIKAAKHFAALHDIDHRIVSLTPEDIVSLIRPTILATCTYDPLTVLSGIGTFAAAQAAAKDGVKVLLSGEGADELFGGYDEYHGLPLSWLDRQLIMDQALLHCTECLRLDSCTMANGIEARVPFLSEPIVRLSRCLPAYCKLVKRGDQVITKHWLRRSSLGLLPNIVANREKTPFYRGAGINTSIEEYAENEISDKELGDLNQHYPAFNIRSKVGALLFVEWEDCYSGLAKSLEELVRRSITRPLLFGRTGI